MKYYRCYLLTADDHIARVTILKCADDADAEQQCRTVVATSERYASAEVWDGARRLYRYPENPETAAQERRRQRNGDSGEDWAIADALSAQVEKDRREELQADSVTAAHRRERRLEQAVDWKGPAGPDDHRSAETSQGSADGGRPRAGAPRNT